MRAGAGEEDRFGNIAVWGFQAGVKRVNEPLDGNEPFVGKIFKKL